MFKLRKLNLKKKEIIRIFLESLVVILFVFSFVVRPSGVWGPSMEPTIQHKSRIFINLTAYYFCRPERSEVIVFKGPHNLKRDYIKRIIGLPGEKVELRGGFVYINGRKLTENYSVFRRYEDLEPVVVPQDSFFVLGDNRLNSEDSRSWGFLPRKNIIGKAMFVFWPLQYIKQIHL